MTGCYIRVVLWFLFIIYEVQVGNAVDVIRHSRRCGDDSITFVASNDTAVTCVKCQECPPGSGIGVECGSVHRIQEMSTIFKRNKCQACPEGTYSPSYSRGFCHLCTECEHGSITLRNCTPTKDSVCGACQKGYYRDPELTFSCLPCSHCCGNEDDEIIKECVTQGPHGNQHCSLLTGYRCSKFRNNMPTMKTIELMHQSIFTKHSIRITESHGQYWIFPTTKVYFKNSDEVNVLFIVSLILVVIIVFSLVFLITSICCRKKANGKHRQCLPLMRLPKRKNIPDMCKSDQSDELEDWSNNDISNSTYSFSCGVLIKYDPDCKQDRYKNLIVEPLKDKDVNSHFKSIKTGQIFLSPIYRFYSKGEKFENKAKIILPHSALWSSEHKNWEIEILCMDERKGKEAKWEKITDGLELNWKDVGFYTDTLLTYAVVGKPLKGAKKRMQFVLFTTTEMISDLFEVCIYLLDDNESSFQNVLKENSLKGFTMLGSFYAAFVDCYSSVDINLNVEGLLDGWELARLNQKTISSSVCKESYFSIPSFQAAFRRVKRRADKFSCKFRINVAENEIIIPAFTFVPEEELCVVVDVHDQDHDTSVIKEKISLFKDLHYDTKYVAGRMLDVSVKGQGAWRQLGRHFGLTDDVVEQFSVEYRTLEGSPSRALFDYLSNTQPNITVGEFAKCLESLGREDVMAVLYKHLKAKKPVNNIV